jgi:hypothetical protein
MIYRLSVMRGSPAVAAKIALPNLGSSLGP